MQDRRITGAIIGAVALGAALIGTALLLLRTPPGTGDAAGIPAFTATPTLSAAAQGNPSAAPATASPAASPPGDTPAAPPDGAADTASAAPVVGTLAPGVTPAAAGDDAAVRYVGDDYDGHDTVLVSEIAPGGNVEGTVAQPFDAHNWEFAGRQGQTVTIRVTGQGETDPRVTLFGPDGQVLSENDDSGGTLNSLLQATLPADGRYTIRVTVWVVGPYTLALEVG